MDRDSLKDMPLGQCLMISGTVRFVTGDDDVRRPVVEELKPMVCAVYLGWRFRNLGKCTALPIEDSQGNLLWPPGTHRKHSYEFKTTERYPVVLWRPLRSPAYGRLRESPLKSVLPVLQNVPVLGA